MARNLANTDKTKKPLTKGLIVAKLPAAVMGKKDPYFRYRGLDFQKR